MIIKVQNETPFQILTGAFTIGPSETGYDLQVGATPQDFATLFSVGANTTRMVTNVANGSYYRLKNNVGEVKVNWSRTCVTEGSGAAGNELIPQESLPATADAGTVVALTNGGVYQYDGTDWNPVGGSDMSAYWTSAETKTYVDSADTAIYNSAATYIAAVESHLADVELVTATALTELHEDLLEVSANTVDLSGYYTSGETDAAISAATSGKADAQNVSANTNLLCFPYWNEQGVITGRDNQQVYDMNININGSNNDILRGVIGNIGPIYAPNNAGTAGDILVSTGGTPVWSAATFAQQSDLNTLSGATEAAIATIPANPVQSTSIDTIWKGTQAEYDALAPNYDPNTFYVII